VNEKSPEIIRFQGIFDFSTIAYFLIFSGMPMALFAD
jgi:hypothetical protein